MKKILLTILSVICAVSMSIGIVGCGSSDNGNKDDNGDKTQHTHTYSTTYSSDDTYHWLAATCEHTDLVDKKGEHTYDEPVLNDDGTMYVYTCTVCGRTENEEISFESPFFGFGAKFDISSILKGLDEEERQFIFEMLAGASSDGLNLDLMGSTINGAGDFALFVRNGVLYLANGSEELEIANLTELQTALGDYDFRIIDIEEIISEAFQTTGMDMETVGVIASALLTLVEDPAIYNLYLSSMMGGYNYLYVESKAVNGNTVTTYDFHKTIDNLLDLLKETATYVDVNMQTATLKSLYDSKAVEDLLNPYFKEISASDLESLLTNLKAIYDVVDFGEEVKPEFEIIEAGELSAYEYIGKYLDMEIKLGEDTIKLGDFPLTVLFGYEEGSENSFAEATEENKTYLDKIMPIFKFSYTTEGVSSEMGKLLGVNFEIKVNSLDEYEDNVVHTTHVTCDFDLVYEDYALVGFTYNWDMDESNIFGDNYYQDIEMSLLPTENGYELKFNDSDDGYVMDFVANVEVLYDDNGEFDLFKVTANAKENGVTVLEFATGLDVNVITGVTTDIVSVALAFAFDEYDGKGELNESVYTGFIYQFTYENNNLTSLGYQIEFSNEYYDYYEEDYVESYMDLYYEVFFTYDDNGLLTKIANEYLYERENCYFSFEDKLMNFEVNFTYNDSELVTKIEVIIEEMRTLTIEYAYDEETELVTSVKLSTPEDFMVVEFKFEYDSEFEVSKIEIIIDFTLTGEANYDGEPLVEPYRGQFKLSIEPIFDGEDYVGIKGVIYVDTREQTFEGSYEFTIFDEEREFIDLSQIDGVKLTLEELAELFDFDFGPSVEEEDYCKHDWDMCYEIIDGESHHASCWYCDFETVEEHTWEDYDGEYYCRKCGAPQSDYE